MHQRRRLGEPTIHALVGVVRDERRRRALQVVPVRADPLDLDRRLALNRVPVDLPHDVELAVGRLEPGDANEAPAGEVAQERGRPRREGAVGVRRGRDTQAVVVARPAFADRSVCGRGSSSRSASRDRECDEGEVSSSQYMT